MKNICLIVSFLWISLGTFIQLSAYPDYNYLGFDYSSFIYNTLWWITIPSNIILWVILFSDILSNIYVLVIFLQLVKVLIYWWIFYKIYLFYSKSKNKSK